MAPRWRAGGAAARERRSGLDGLLLALLVLGHEICAVASATGGNRTKSRKSARTAGDDPRETGLAEADAVEVWSIDEWSAGDAEADARRLAAVALNTLTDWQWPPTLKLALEYSLVSNGVVQGSKVVVNTPPETEIVALASGSRDAADGGTAILYNKLRISIEGSNFRFSFYHDNAAVKLVTTNNRYQCWNNDFKVPVGIAARDNGVAGAMQTTVKGDMGYTHPILSIQRKDPSGADDVLETESKIVFMWGGIYYMCYTPDGSFDEATSNKENVVSVRMRVLGVRSPCAASPASPAKADGCIENERWDCFFSYEGDGNVQNCIFNFKDDGARLGWSVFAGDRSKVTWSDPYDGDTVDAVTGQYSGTNPKHPKWCAVGAPATVGIFNTEEVGDILTASPSEAATMPAVRRSQTSAFSISACYCPSYDLETGNPCVGMTGNDADICCAIHEEFVQMVGVVYYWTIRICDMDNYAGIRGPGSPDGCASPYRRVLPQQRFVLRIECPPGGGCESAGANLVKYVDITVDSDLPSWKETHPCKVSPESPSAVWPTAAASVSLSGGSRVDYKVWYNQPVKINKSLKQRIDVCYSNSNSPVYFFKVGTIKTADAFAIASKFPDHWNAGSQTGKKTVRYAGAEGSFTLYSGISGADPSPYDGNPFSGKAMAYFMSYDREKLWGSGASLKTLESFLGFDKTTPWNAQTQLDTECQRFSGRPSLFLINDNPLPMAKVVGAENTNSKYHTFSGTTQDRYVTVNMAGVIAVCYCAIISDSGLCEIPSNWIYAGRFTIQGPMGDKQWEFNLFAVVKLEVTGWGLSSNDRLRIISSSDQCSDFNGFNGNPSSDTSSFKTGCPSAMGLNCQFPTTTSDISLKAFSGPGKDRIGNEQSITITAAQVFDDYTLLTFSAPILDLISAGDIITIASASIIVNSKAKVDETPIERHAVYQLSGEYTFQDTLYEPGEELDSYQVGHKVSLVTNNGVVDQTKLSIPLGWPIATRPAFTFPAIDGEPGGRWTVRNRVETAEEIKPMLPSLPNADLKVCWGIQNGGVTTYYKQAGLVKFIAPPAMSEAAVYLTTKQAGAIAPTVIYFKTNPARTQYASTTGKTKLMLRFVDVSEDEGTLVPFVAEDHQFTYPTYGGCPRALAADDQVFYRNAKQFLCGKLFSELWSEDSEGFPVPWGCYYSPRYRDAADPGGDGLTNTNNFFREVTIVFNNLNGLKANTKYMMVMNAKNPAALNVVAGPVPAVDLFAMCAEEAGCQRPYMVIEKSTASIDMATVARGSNLNNPRIANGGFAIQAPNDEGILNLSEKNIIQVKITGGAGQQAIKPQAILRMYMWPLTQWNVGQAACTAKCQPSYENSAAICTGLVSCTPEPVVNPAQFNAYNVVKLTLPSTMTDITDVTSHTVIVQSLTLPQGGFFPTRLGVQLTKDDDTDPSYQTSAGMVWKYPEAGRTEGRLVLTGPTGSGTKPFVSDTNNKLVVRLQFGATLWNWGEAGLAAMFEVRLPPGYTCQVLLQGEPASTLDVFNVDANLDDYRDNSRGLLHVGVEDGNYARSTAGSCFYELFKYNRIFERQVVYIELDVINPADPLRKDDRLNAWAIQLSSKGAYGMDPSPGGKSMPYVGFTNDSTIALNENAALYFAGNAAVIKELEKPLFQPGRQTNSMSRSCCGATFDTRKAIQFMRVFFKPGRTIGLRGYVIVDAPNGFDFEEQCTVQDLDPVYYAYVGDQDLRLKPLKPPLICEGNRYPRLTARTYNRARIRVAGLIDSVTLIYYGFEVMVIHPTTYSTDQQDQWRLWLEDSQAFPLEGSRNTVLFNPKQAATQTLFYQKSWGMYANPIEGIRIFVANLRPYTISNAQDSTITIWPIVFSMATQTSLRITAPLGFAWNTDWGNFRPTANCTELLACEPFGGAADLLPQVESTVDNALIWSQVYFNTNVKYGFQHKIRIPDNSPRTSANAFYFEFGYQKTTIDERMFAVAVEAPMVAALINCKVGFNTNQVGITDNRMQFEFQTMTPIGANGGLVIKGDQNTKGFTFTQQYTVLSDSDPLPADVALTTMKEADQTPRINLRATEAVIPPGYYKFELQVANPTARILTPGVWTFGTYSDVSQYPTKYYLDNEAEAPGFVISNRMQYAGFYSITAAQKIATEREDRPGYMNNLIIEFELRNRPEEVYDMTLKAPHGFIFEDDCMGPPEDPWLKTSKNTVFGDNTGGLWPAGDLAEWTANAFPTACRGDGRQAVITIPIGLQVLNRYAFRIRVQNPLQSPDWNKWTLNYNSESSDPFPGFNIWTSVGNPTATPVSYAKNQGGSADPIVNPVTVKFRPYKTVPSKPSNEDRGGVLRVELPIGFTFVQVNNECQVDFRVTGSPTAVRARDLLCEVDTSFTKMNLYMIGNTQITGEESGIGNEYQLIVYVYNPEGPQAASDWHLNTFSKWTREPQYSLDESPIPGFAIGNDLWTFTVTNMMQQYNGNQLVRDVECVLNFRDNVKDGDDIVVFAPKGFNIVSNPELNTCENYRPVGATPDWFPFTGAPNCICDEVTNGPLCRLQWTGIKEGKDPAFAQKQDLRFKLGTRNPAKTPFITDNYWRVEHSTGTGALFASQIARSWDVNPQLAGVVIAFADGYRSAGSQANLDITFTPVNYACCLELSAEFPTEFDFSQASVFSNYDILVQEGPRIVINLRTPGLVADQQITVRIYNVRLGRGGGQTEWNLMTYLEPELVNRLDETLHFSQGAFRLPGKVSLLGVPDLTSVWKESRLLYPVKSLFQPRVNEWATAEFRVKFSQPVYSQGKLVVNSQGAGDTKGYALRTDGFVVIGTGQIDAIPLLDSVSGAITATLKANRPATEVALVADTPYTISMRVYPRSNGVNTWRFDTIDSLPGFTNTNDGDAAGFSPVLDFNVTVTVVRSPPQAVIDVRLDVDQKTSVVRELMVIAPAGFYFDDGPNGCGDMCVPGQALGSTGRRTATLASPTGEPLTNLKGLIIKVKTPERTPIGDGSEGIMWFVEGRGQGIGTTVGWGQGAGFAVTQMSGTAVYYAGVANTRATQLAITFTLDEDAGSTISVVPPAGFLLTCSVEGSLKTISLPGGRPNCIDDPLQLQLQQPLTKGTYSFTLTADLPPQTPEVNSFNIIIQDAYSKVVDAAYGVTGQDIVPIAAEAPTLAWSRADPGQPTMITIGVTFTADTLNLKALLIVLPELFQHDVQIPIDVQNLNSRFPLAPGNDWADTTETDRIKIFLDDNEETTTIPAGTYRWNFPALVPPNMPRRNIWFLALCDDRSCSQPSDRSVAVSFPMAGFAMYEVAPEALRLAASGAEEATFRRGVGFTLLALLSLTVLHV